MRGMQPSDRKQRPAPLGVRMMGWVAASSREGDAPPLGRWATPRPPSRLVCPRHPESQYLSRTALPKKCSPEKISPPSKVSGRLNFQALEGRAPASKGNPPKLKVTPPQTSRCRLPPSHRRVRSGHIPIEYCVGGWVPRDGPTSVRVTTSASSAQRCFPAKSMSMRVCGGVSGTRCAVGGARPGGVT